MLLKWNERQVKQVSDTSVKYTIPVQGKVIVSVAKRALSAKIREVAGDEAQKFTMSKDGKAVVVYAAPAWLAKCHRDQASREILCGGLAEMGSLGL